MTVLRSAHLPSFLFLALLGAVIFGPDPIASEVFNRYVLSSKINAIVPISTWLLVYLVTNVASVRFVRNHSAARWSLVCFAGSHLVVGGIILIGGAADFEWLVTLVVLLGWAFVIAAIYRHRSEINTSLAYGFWAITMIILCFAGMKFEVYDLFVWSNAYATFGGA